MAKTHSHQVKARKLNIIESNSGAVKEEPITVILELLRKPCNLRR